MTALLWVAEELGSWGGVGGLIAAQIRLPVFTSRAPQAQLEGSYRNTGGQA